MACPNLHLDYLDCVSDDCASVWLAHSAGLEALGGIGSGYDFLGGRSKPWFYCQQLPAQKVATTVEAQRAPQRLDGTAIRRDSSVVAEAQRRRTARGWTWASVIVRALTATINAPRFDPFQGLKQEASEIALKPNAPNPHCSYSPICLGATEPACASVPQWITVSRQEFRARAAPLVTSNAIDAPAVPPSPPHSPTPVFSSARHESPAVPPTPPPTPPPSPAGIEVDVSNPVAAVCWTETHGVSARADWGLRLADNKVSLGAHSFEMANTVQRFIPVRRGNRLTGKGWWSTVKWDSAIPVRRGCTILLRYWGVSDLTDWEEHLSHLT
ncbi:hypothetical protein C8R47DRAFT_1230755 [Mycena vitilis]|nr:hypothetical protein C8R47DRAFT_1230755 [Mycena vitilis]